MTSKQHNSSRGRSVTAGAHVGTLTGNPVSEKCGSVEDLSGRTLRELLTLARERLGPAASGLKTRAELVDALTSAGAGSAPTVHPERSRGTLVTRDFFRHRTE